LTLFVVVVGDNNSLSATTTHCRRQPLAGGDNVVGVRLTEHSRTHQNKTEQKGKQSKQKIFTFACIEMNNTKRLIRAPTIQVDTLDFAK
jgi:hypothetical protein